MLIKAYQWRFTVTLTPAENSIQPWMKLEQCNIQYRSAPGSHL